MGKTIFSAKKSVLSDFFCIFATKKEMEATNIAILRFKENLSSVGLRCFRGAIIDLAGRENPYFHNHEANGLRYGYPLVQYKVIDRHVCLVGIAEAAMAVMELVGKFPASLKIGQKEMEFHVEDCTLTPYFPKIEESPKLYRLSCYIGLTDENFKKYHSMLALTDKVNFLEQVITGNILSFLKGIGYHAAEKIECAITQLKEPVEQSYKHVKFDTFDLMFVSNMVLPDGIALGKSGSVGFGTLSRRELPDRFKNFNQ